MTEPQGAPSGGSETQAMGASGEPPEPAVGREIDDFLLVDELGEGAFAKVYLAHQKSLHRTVALKISTARSEEAQTLAQLDHPNIVRVFDQREVAGQDLHLLYMEYVPAGTLEPLIERIKEAPPEARRGRLVLEIVDAALAKRGAEPPIDSMLREQLDDASWPDAVAILGSHLALALDYAHSQKVLHRDVKPANVLLAPTGRAKLADFNISWSSEVGGGAGEYMGGSLPYMSPEQLAAASPFHDGTPEDLDHRSDIYGLGVVLWELLTGSLPLPEPESGEGWEKLFSDLVESRSAGVPKDVVDALPADVPPILRDILIDCLTADLAKRPQSGAELARRFELCLNPRVRELLTPPTSGWQRLLVRLPLIGMLVIAITPNAALSGLNVVYNAQRVVPESDWDDFYQQVSLVNGIAFPVGIAILLWLCWPVIAAVRRRRRGDPVPLAERPPIRKRALRLGGIMAAVVLPLWIVGGAVFPIWNHMRMGEASGEDYFYFTLSNGMFGALAASACFFFLNFVVARVLLPWLTQPGEEDGPAAAQIARLHGRLAYYFLIPTLVPFISVIVLALLPGDRAVFGVLGVMGAAGFAVSFWLIAQIRRDLDALQVALGPRRGRYGAEG